MNPVIYALIAALAFGMWTVFHRLAASYINQTLGAIVVSSVAVIFGLVVLLSQKRSGHLVTNGKGLLFVGLAGLAAFLIDYFALKTYASGLPVTVGGPIIIGGSIAVATVIGFVALGDSITVAKMIGLVFVVTGAAILSVYQ